MQANTPSNRKELRLLENLPSLVSGLYACHHRPDSEIDRYFVQIIFTVSQSLGFHAFVIDTWYRVKNKHIRRFFSVSRSGTAQERELATLNEILEKLESHRDDDPNDYRFVTPDDIEPILAQRFGQSRPLRGLAIKELAQDRRDYYFRIAILADVAAIGAGSNYWITLACAISAAITSRDSKFSYFPHGFSEFLWRQAMTTYGKPSNGFVFPSNSPKTVTLSLDLRRSTFAMEKAIDHGVFSEWMNGLINIFQMLIEYNYGVFDKFTGDGVLAHFLDENDMPGDNNPRKPELSAVSCAAEMIEATEIYLDTLRPYLRYESQRFGASVGIASGNAHWSLAGANGPIIVGHGVVDACRLCSRASPRQILMAVHTYHTVRHAEFCNIFSPEQVSFDGKDYPTELELQVWGLRPKASCRTGDIRSLVDKEIAHFKGRINFQSQ